MPKKSTTPEQKVGRGQPPKHRQFKKGASGNPGGRPKGRKNLATIINQAAGDKVIVTINGQKTKISKLQAAAMQLATQAASGDKTAIPRLMDWVDKLETRSTAAKPSEFPFAKADIEIIHAIYARMKLCEGPDSQE